MLTPEFMRDPIRRSGDKRVQLTTGGEINLSTTEKIAEEVDSARIPPTLPAERWNGKPTTSPLIRGID